MLIVKAVCGDVSRRFVVDLDVAWAELSAQIRGAFGLSEVRVRYRDSEGDLVTIESDDDLYEAVKSCAVTANMYVLSVEVSHRQKPDASSLVPAVEHGVQCKGCATWIRGVRYRCAMCDDFDLCEGCETFATHDETHVFMKLKRMVACAQGPLLAPFTPIIAVPRDSAHAWQLQQAALSSMWDARGQPPPIAGASKQRPRSHSTGECGMDVKSYLARFVRDVACPDGTVVAPGERFVKVWRMENNGQEAWPRGTRLVSAGGNTMGGVTEIAIAPTKPSEERDLAIELVAPAEEGRHVGYWRLTLPDGTRFGHRVWVDITVDGASSRRATQSVSASAGSSRPASGSSYSPLGLFRSILGRVGVTGAADAASSQPEGPSSSVRNFPVAPSVPGQAGTLASNANAAPNPSRRSSTVPLNSVPERDDGRWGKGTLGTRGGTPPDEGCLEVASCSPPSPCPFRRSSSPACVGMGRSHSAGEAVLRTHTARQHTQRPRSAVLESPQKATPLTVENLHKLQSRLRREEDGRPVSCPPTAQGPQMVRSASRTSSVHSGESVENQWGCAFPRAPASPRRSSGPWDAADGPVPGQSPSRGTTPACADKGAEEEKFTAALRRRLCELGVQESALSTREGIIRAAAMLLEQAGQ
eukprot:Opistho-1_new@99092